MAKWNMCNACSIFVLRLDLVLIFNYCAMDSLIAYPQSKEQLDALKAVMKAMKISFKQTETAYPEGVVQGIKASLQQAEDGTLSTYTGIKDMLEAK
jgi:hypothetical protein